jgi:hypothetical protein
VNPAAGATLRADVTSLLLVVNPTHTVSGTAGSIWVSHLGLAGGD